MIRGREFVVLIAVAVFAAACNEDSGSYFRINAGGAIWGAFISDLVPSARFQLYPDDSLVESTTNTIDASGVVNPAPDVVYQSSRVGNPSSTLLPDTLAYELHQDLDAGVVYRVRLHFAELTATAANQRKFDVMINEETPVLDDFDVYAEAGGQRKAIARDFLVPTLGDGRLFVVASGVVGEPAIAGIEVTAPYRIDIGGGSFGPWMPDIFSGGTVETTTTDISLGDIDRPAPKPVYQSVRTGALTYTFPDLGASGTRAANATYLVRLHFAEHSCTYGARRFDVVVNGTTVLEDFDIASVSGGWFRALVRETTAKVASDGTITVALVAHTGTTCPPAISGIEILPSPAHRINAGGGNVAPFVANDFGSGGINIATTDSIDRSHSTDPAPEAVYQSAREGSVGDGPPSYTFDKLRPFGRYLIRLHFAEIAYSEPGHRSFNVLVNDSERLHAFDVAGSPISIEQTETSCVPVFAGPNTSVVRELVERADGMGTLTIATQNGALGEPILNGVEVIPDDDLRVNACGGGVGEFQADHYVVGGVGALASATVDTSAVEAPAPAEAYQTLRAGNFTYRFPGLVRQVTGTTPVTPHDALYKVRLHFAEPEAGVGERQFNVYINDEPALEMFDVRAAAGALDTAVSREFLVKPTTAGEITVQFVSAVGDAFVNAIEVLRMTAENWPEADALFTTRDRHFLGGDGGYSVDLGDERTLWLFADTYLDMSTGLTNQTRADYTQARNTVGLQQGSDPRTAAFQIFYSPSHYGGLADYLPPPSSSGRGRWPQSGIVVNGRLLMFYEDTQDFHAENVLAAGVVTTDDFSSNDANTWTLVDRALTHPRPFTDPLHAPQALWHEDGYLYAWGGGALGDFCSGTAQKVYLWRYSDEQIANGDFTDPEYLADIPTIGHAFRTSDLFEGDPVVVSYASNGGMTIHRNAAGSYVYTQGGIAFGPLMTRTAPLLTDSFFTAPDADPINLFHSVEESRGFAAYMWRAHPQLTGVRAGETIVSYSSNYCSFCTQNEVYYPRFVRMITP